MKFLRCKIFLTSSVSAKKSFSIGGSTSEKKARSSLCELSQLLQQGEKQGMFREYMPPRIMSTITYENLTFLKNRDVFSQDYYNFIQQICSANSVSKSDTCSIELFSEETNQMSFFWTLWGSN